jgi:hypothetical protein
MNSVEDQFGQAAGVKPHDGGGRASASMPT